MRITDKLVQTAETALRKSIGFLAIDESTVEPATNCPYQFSIEVFPPKTVAGLQNLYPRLARLGSLGPLFIDVTYASGGETWEISLEICKVAQRAFSLDAMLHVACIGMTEDKCLEILNAAKDAQIQNLLIIRGDEPVIHKRNNPKAQAEPLKVLNKALDMVQLTRKHFGDYFCIGVAGFPEGRVGCGADKVDDGIAHLTEKVTAGADFILTQVFFDPEVFLTYMRKCREAGINVPIIPGLMPITGYQQLVRVVKLAGITIPEGMAKTLDSIRNDDAKVQAYGQQVLQEIILKLKESGESNFHFFTMNLEQPLTQILLDNQLSTVGENNKRRTPTSMRSLPFSQAQADGALGSRRESETVRPIHWQYRPSTYKLRTSEWDRYPNGRWGDSSSPAYGSLSNYHLLTLHTSAGDKTVSKCGVTIRSERDVFRIMSAFIEGKFPSLVLPWHDEPIAKETEQISSSLKELNDNGFMTINSQPRINAVPSSDPIFGWGPADGVVYQKAYLEFFCSAAKLEALFQILGKYPTMSLLAENEKGERRQHKSQGRVQALTWGVFPESEIVQPTVTDQESFTAWREEAFGLWRVMWSDKLEAGTKARDVLESMISKYYLVSVVDHNYIDGDLFGIFNEIIDTAREEAPVRKPSINFFKSKKVR
ncbi:hypothetical protein SARC_08722, partial [Sphaeroforma arctica JP610]